MATVNICKNCFNCLSADYSIDTICVKCLMQVHVICCEKADYGFCCYSCANNENNYGIKGSKQQLDFHNDCLAGKNNLNAENQHLRKEIIDDYNEAMF